MKDLAVKNIENNLCSEIKDGFALLDLARGWLKQGNSVVSIELLKSALNSDEADKDQVLRAKILKECGRAHMMQSEWEIADQFYQQAQTLFDYMDHYKGTSECARNRANLYFQKGRYSESEKFCKQALGFAASVDNHELRASILNTLAAIKSATGDYREAVKIFKLCLADFQSSGNLIRQGYVLLNIGLTYTELGEFSNAVSDLNSALSIALDQKDLNLVEICYLNIAKCYLNQNETLLARSVIETARKILPGLNCRSLETELNLIECQILRKMGNFAKAESQLNDTLNLAIVNKLDALEADIVFEQGLLLRDKGLYSQAVSKFDAAANQYKQIGVDKGLKETITALKELKRNMHDC